MSGLKHTITLIGLDLSINEVELELSYHDYEVIERLAKALNKNAIDDSYPILEIEK